MSESAPDLEAILPNAAPTHPERALLLFAMRRIAAGGLGDAHAAHAMIGLFGVSFRRPLILVRALMAEVSRVSRRKLLVAPACCPRMTGAEGELLDTVLAARDRPRVAHDRLAAMLGVENCLGALSSAQAVAQAFEDCGRPLR